jgi:UDP-N-acetylglucosamine 2-epimerase (non-hydrolysing)
VEGIMKKVMLVFGTRPDAIKMCPLVNELKKRQDITTVVCISGQHREMLREVLEIFDVHPDYNLDIMRRNQTLGNITTDVLKGIENILTRERPDIVLVHGDTTTAFSAALACFYKNIPVGHVEAGLRSNNILEPFPEEYNRKAISLISSYDFAPTENAKDNLMREGKSRDKIFVTGNTVADALKITVRADFRHSILNWASGKRLVVLTAHRRENIGEAMRSIFGSVKRIVSEYEDICVLYPVHPNPSIKKIAYEEDEEPPRKLIGFAREDEEEIEEDE